MVEAVGLKLWLRGHLKPFVEFHENLPVGSKVVAGHTKSDRQIHWWSHKPPPFYLKESRLISTLRLLLGLRILTAVRMTMLFLWVVTPCRLVGR